MGRYNSDRRCIKTMMLRPRGNRKETFFGVFRKRYPGRCVEKLRQSTRGTTKDLGNIGY